MFEKEAEEIVYKNLCSKAMCYNHCNFSSPKHHRCGEWHRLYEGAKDGAEFGYNKGKEDVKTTILKLRNCMNCKYRDTRGYSSCKDKGIVLCSHWEMKE